MSVKLISSSPLSGNAALFKNDEIAADNQGDITWSNVEGEEGDYSVTFSGTDVEGGTIDSTTTTIQIEPADTTNPTKVFWAIVKAVGELVCPTCSNGY